MYQSYPKKIELILNKFFGKIKNEVEQYQIEEGEFFGDFGIIKDIKRTASAYVLQESYLLCIDKFPFDEYFLRSILKCEAERKIFIRKNLKVLYGFHRFHEYYDRLTIYVNNF